jgi:hypothetical protein
MIAEIARKIVGQMGVATLNPSMGQVSFADIKEEFDETLGYIQQGITWLLDRTPR